MRPFTKPSACYGSFADGIQRKERKLNRLYAKLTTLVCGFLLLAGARPAECKPTAKVTAPSFFQGTLNGGDIQNWTLWLSTTSKESLGVTFGTGGPAPTDHLLAARAEGTVKKKGRGFAIDLKLFAVTGSDVSVRVGRILGTSSPDGGYTGTFTLAGRSGTFSVTPAVAAPASVAALVGNYSSDGRDAEVQLNLASNGTFTLEGRVLGRAVGQAVGNWQVDSDGYLWLLPTRIAESNEFFDLTIKLRVPLKLRAVRSGNQLELFEPINNNQFASLTRH